MTDSFKSEELDTWLAEVELTHDYVKKLSKGEISVEELDKKELKKIEEEKKKEAEKRRKDQEKLEKIKLGREGKGEKEDYMNFCRGCFLEFTLETKNCWKCGRKTISCAERREELFKKVENFKKNKELKEERKKKWELWKKTKAMLWKKTSTNYSKWDYFTESSDEEKNVDSDPILPKNDPNFKALEEDLEKRKKQREMDKKKADELKDKGNAALKAGDLKKAVEYYSEGLDIKRDHKVLYTNRALAYNKLKKYSKAVADCTRLLEFCECFEKGYEESRDVCFKALIRRAFAWKEDGNLEDAKKDILEALKLVSNSEEAKQLSNEIDIKIEHKKKVQDLKGKETVPEAQDNSKETNKAESKQNEGGRDAKPISEDYLEKVNTFIVKEDLSAEDLQQFTKIIIKNEKAKLYFFEKKGMEKCLNLLKKGTNCYLLLNSLSQENLVFQEKFLNLGGIDFLLNRITEITEKISENNGFCDELEDIFEVLVTFSRTDKIRQTLFENEKSIHIFKRCFEVLTPEFGKEYNVLSSFFSYSSNLCFGAKRGSFIRRIEADFPNYLTNLETILGSKNRSKFASLFENIYNFLTSILTDSSFREKFLYRSLTKVLIKRLTQLDFRSNNLWIPQGESLLALFVNLTFQASEKMLDLLDEEKLALPLINLVKNLDINKKAFETCLVRSTQVLSKIKYGADSPVDGKLLEILVKLCSKKYYDCGIAGNTLRVLTPLLSSKDLVLRALIEGNLKNVDELIDHTRNMIKNDHEQRFCNSCNLSEHICALWPSKLTAYNDLIPLLINIVKDKVGNMRKNAAIFLAKLSRNSDNLITIRENHGIEILHSVSSFILQK